jgi:hypothetical protein
MQAKSQAGSLTGFHVHIDAKGISLDALKALVVLYRDFEPVRGRETSSKNENKQGQFQE